MTTEKTVLCPLMRGPCVEDGAILDGKLVSCRFWIKVQGRHPQTGAVVDHHDCAICWAPVLLIENSKVNRETGASIDSFRNEMTTSSENLVKVMATMKPPIRVTGSPQVSVAILEDTSPTQ